MIEPDIRKLFLEELENEGVAAVYDREIDWGFRLTLQSKSGEPLGGVAVFQNKKGQANYKPQLRRTNEDIAHRLRRAWERTKDRLVCPTITITNEQVAFIQRLAFLVAAWERMAADRNLDWTSVTQDIEVVVNAMGSDGSDAYTSLTGDRSSPRFWRELIERLLAVAQARQSVAGSRPGIG